MWTVGWERGDRSESHKGWGSCSQTWDHGRWGFVTTSRNLALQVSNARLLGWNRGSSFFGNYCTFCKCWDTCPVNTKNEIFCVQVKNKPCVKYIIVMHLIPWIRSHGSETLLIKKKKSFIDGSILLMVCMTDSIDR
jgi:hypothetical protein